MTLRFLHQRCAKISLKYNILILVILLTTRMIQCDEETTAEYDPDHTTLSTDLDENIVVHVNGTNCGELLEAAEKNASCDTITEFVKKYVDPKIFCVVRREEDKKFCQAIYNCPGVGNELQSIFKHSVIPLYLSKKNVTLYLKRRGGLECISKMTNFGERVTEFLSLIIFLFVVSWFLNR